MYCQRALRALLAAAFLAGLALWIMPVGATAQVQPPVPVGAGNPDWQRIEAPEAPAIARPTVAGLNVTRLEQSQVDPQLAYAFLAAGRMSALLRTTDAGASWTELQRVEGELCAWVAPVLTPDPNVRDRLLFSVFCAAGRTTSASLLVSEDAGTTFRTVAQPGSSGPPHRIPQFLFPQAAVMDPTGQHVWIAARRDQRLGGSAVLGSRDGGVTWSVLLEFPTVRNANAYGAVHAKPEVEVTDLVADFSGPRQLLFLGLGGAGRGVLASEPGGVSWVSLGQTPPGPVTRLRWDPAPGGGSLRATTEGVAWRFTPGVTPLGQDAGPRHAPWAGLPAAVMSPADSVSLSGPAPPADRLARPYWVAVEPDGAVLVANWGDRDGARPPRLVRAWPGSDIPVEALGEPPKTPTGSVWRADGITFVADPVARVVRAVAADGSASVVAGTGARGAWLGDGLPAVETPLDEPWALALDTAGRVIIVDRAGQRVLRLEEDGTLRTIAGTGRMGYTGDGGPATSARLGFPVAATVDQWGRLYLADLLNNAVRVVDSDGTIWTLAGPPERGATPAGTETSVALELPMAVAWDGAGGVYVASHGNDLLVYVPVVPPGA